MLFCPLTHPQKRIWYIEKMYPGTSVNNIGGPVRIKGSIDLKLLERAINVFIASNDAVRLRLVEENGEVKQYVHGYKYVNVDSADFSEEGTPETAYNLWVDVQAKIPFVLENSDLFYFSLFKISENDCGYLVKLHHIVCDGWSVQLMTEQICQTYKELLKGTISEISKKPSYIEYANSEREYLQSDRFIRNKEYWLNKLDGLPDEIQIRNSGQLEGKRKTYDLSPQISENIQRYIKEARVSLNTFFASAFLIYLSVVTQRDDNIIGIPVLNRSGATEKGIIGMFTSTMPLRLYIDTNNDLHDIIRLVNSEIKKCLFNQKYPYDLLVQDLEIKKKGYSHLFDICVNYYNTKLAMQLDGAPIENIEFFNGNLIYSMQIIIKEWSETGKLILDFDYRTSDYTSLQIDNIFSCLCNIIEQILANDKQKIKDTQILTEWQIQQQKYLFNSIACEYPSCKTVYQLFDEQVIKMPDRIAISHENKSITYRELQRKSNILANYLIKKGIEEERIVGLITVHSIETIIGIFGIMKAGGAYLPIDPGYPADRIKYMLGECRVSAIVTNCIIDPSIEFLGEHIDLRDTRIFEVDENIPECINKSSDLAYVIYTSGSTGEPKGVMVEHQGLTNYVWWARNTYVKEQMEVFPLYTSLSFDLTVTSIFVPLISGGSVIVYDNNNAEFALHRIFKDNEASVVKLTPSHLMLIKDMDNSQSSIKKLIVGGEDLKADLARSIYDSFRGNVEIFNEYGPTETVVGCMIHRFDMETDKITSVPIGKPIDNVQVYILDKNMRFLPAGCAGELYVSGDCVARGYIDKTKDTEEKFKSNPYEKGKRMYKTGDLAKFNEDGIIVYAGRTDRQLKIRGYRIEPHEVEKHLLRYEGVQNAVIVDKQGANGSRFLCAYVAALKALDVNGIKDYLKQFIPVYAVPERYVFLKEIPLTKNGKIDYHMLPEPAVELNNDYVNPRSTVEEALVKLIAELLDLKAVGVKDNFYRLGGDSIKAIQLSSRVNNIGYRLKVKDILSSPIIEEMARHVEKADVKEDEHCFLEGNIKATPITAWFFSRNFQNPNYYNQSILLDVLTDIDKAQLDRVFHVLIAHHDSLRINCNIETGELYYNNHHLMDAFDVDVYDLSDYQEDMCQDIMQYVCKRAMSEFDIEKKLLIKACLFNFGNHPKKLFITVHHLAIDGISWRILVEDISMAMECIIGKREIALPKKSSSYQEWGEWVNAQANRLSIKNEKSYWDEVVSNEFVFPTDYKPLRNCILKNCTFTSLQLPVEKTGQLLCNATSVYNIQAGELLLAILAITVMEYVGSTEIVLEVENHGRKELEDFVDLSRTVGWFTSIYPVHFQLSDYADVDAAIKSLKEQIRNIHDYGIGYGILKYLMNEIDDKYENTRIRFNYLGDMSEFSTGSYIKLSDSKLTVDSDNGNYITCLMDINAAIIDKKLTVSATYSRDIFRDETCSYFLRSFKENIIRIIDFCCNRTDVVYTPSDFDMVSLSQDELDRLFE